MSPNKCILFISTLFLFFRFGLCGINRCSSTNSSSANRTQMVNCTNSIDLFLVIDTSDKLDKNEFDFLKLKLTQEIKKFNSSKENLNINFALMTYSDKITLVVPLSHQPVSLENLISKITLLEQNKNTHLLPRAIHFVQTFLLKNLNINSNRTKIVILLTDGVLSSNEMRLVRKEANLLKHLANLMAISVGSASSTSKNNLNTILTCPNYFVKFDNFVDTIQDIISKTC